MSQAATQAGNRSRAQLGLRRRPAQARSAATFAHILDTAALLLDEVGWDGFTTNLLARRAGVGLQALYRYFPNKLAVVSSLAQRMIAQWDSWYADFEPVSLDTDAGWDAAFDRFIAGLRAMPGGVALRRAMQASPQLRELDRQDNARLAAGLARLLQARDPARDEQELLAAARVILESVVAIIDLSFELPPAEAARLIAQSKKMQLAFVRQSFPVPESAA